MNKGIASAVLLSGLLYAGASNAALLLCQDSTVNHMYIDDSQVAACMDAGTGNLTGNPGNDLFLTGAGAGYESAGKSDGSNPFAISFTQNGGTGTFSFDASFWDSYSGGAIGFKFGTGNNPDGWFVFELLPEIAMGDWQFVNVFTNPAGRPIGGGLSHVNLYGIPGGVAIPEPATQALMLLGLGLLGMGYRHRRSQRSTA